MMSKILTNGDTFIRLSSKHRNEQFLHFPQCFQLNQITVSPFVHIFDIITLFDVESEEPKIGISGKGLSERRPFRFFTSDRIKIYMKKQCKSSKVRPIELKEIIFLMVFP